jgi:hypothetical protein
MNTNQSEVTGGCCLLTLLAFGVAVTILVTALAISIL